MNFEKLQMIAINNHGSGSKVYQSFFDNHPEICMIPGYQLMYLYPHWFQWKKNKKINTWDQILNNLKFNHPSLFDSREFPGSESLDKLGNQQDEFIQVNFKKFKSCFLNYTKDKAISSKNLILAIHYSYYYTLDINMKKLKIILYHIHVPYYINDFLIKDFPNLKVITLIRDIRGYIYRKFNNGFLKTDMNKLNLSDFILIKSTRFKYTFQTFCDSLDYLKSISIKNQRVVKHEDLIFRFDDMILNTLKFMDISYDNSLKYLTFGSKKWKTSFYNFDKSYNVNPEIISNKWQTEMSKIDIFFIEGVFYDFLVYYNYKLLIYNNQNYFHRIIIFLFIFLPTRKELVEFFNLILNLPKFLKSLLSEIFFTHIAKIYNHNAYYSHKWCNLNYKFHERLLLKKIITNKKNNKFYFLLSILYFFISLFRYLKQVISYPLIILKRIKLTLYVIQNRLKKRRVLPKLL